MPSEKSARVSVRKAQYNRRVKSAASTTVAAARETIKTGNPQESRSAVERAASALDRAAKRKAIHPNNASRKKSSLARKITSLNG